MSLAFVWHFQFRILFNLYKALVICIVCVYIKIIKVKVLNVCFKVIANYLHCILVLVETVGICARWESSLERQREGTGWVSPLLLKSAPPETPFIVH